MQYLYRNYPLVISHTINLIYLLRNRLKALLKGMIKSMSKDNSLNYIDLERLVLFIVLLLLAFRFIQITISILILFALVFLVFLLLNPVVVWVEKRKIKRGWAALITVVTVLIIFAVLILVLLPPIIIQSNKLIDEIPQITQGLLAQLKTISEQIPYLESLSSDIDLGKIVSGPPLVSGLAKIGSNIVTVIFFGALGIFLVIFMLANPKPIIMGLLQFFPEQKVFRVREGIIFLSRDIATWFYSALTIGIINGITVAIGLTIVGVPFAFVFGILYAMAEFIPYIGPLAVAILAIFFALSQSFVAALVVLIILIIVQILEATVWGPLILSRNLDLHPVSIIFGVLTAETLLGVLGALLAIPFLLTIKIFYYEFYKIAFPPNFLEDEAVEVIEMQLDDPHEHKKRKM